MHFDGFACIDWSGALGPFQKGIALAICGSGKDAPTLVPPPGRYWSRHAILDWMQDQARRNRRILIGMDISPALPFVDADGYFPGWAESPLNTQSLWSLVDALCSDEPHLSAGQFLAHPEARRHFRHRGNCGDLFGTGRGRLRVCEHGQSEAGLSPYSCFNLVGAAQVGKSSLTAMRLLHQLAGAIPVWPFEHPRAAGPVIVEIYTSLAARRTGLLSLGRSKIRNGKLLDEALAIYDSAPHTPLEHYNDHATDALLTSAWLRHGAHHAHFWSPTALNEKIAATEGWTFGVN